MPDRAHPEKVTNGSSTRRHVCAHTPVGQGMEERSKRRPTSGAEPPAKPPWLTWPRWPAWRAEGRGAVAVDRVLIQTPRLQLRPWSPADARDALDIYGDATVTRWLTPVLPRIADERTMRDVLEKWAHHTATSADPAGHWAIVRRSDDAVLGGLAIRDLETQDGDLELAWQLAQRAWGHGYAAEGALALAAWGLARTDVDELLALVRPRNQRSQATAQRIGMEWVGETDKFHGLRLLVYRLRAADLLPPTVVAGRADAPPLKASRSWGAA